MPALSRTTASLSRAQNGLTVTWETLLLTDLVANRSAQCADQCLLCLLQSGPYNGAGLCISSCSP